MLLTGIHLMQVGQVEANLLKLNEQFKLPYINDLVQRKLAGPEQSTLPEGDFEVHQREYERLRNELQQAFDSSSLPENASAGGGLNELLVRLRLDG